MKIKLTQSQKLQMYKSLKKIRQDGILVIYCFVNKQSASGLFSNQRLILLNSAQKSIRYYSRQPQKFPFLKLQDVSQGKSKIKIDQITNFKCQPIKGKTTTVQIQWTQNKNNFTWIFTFANTKVMNQWLTAVEEIKNGSILNDPTYQPIQTLPQSVQTKKSNNQNDQFASNLLSFLGVQPTKVKKKKSQSRLKSQNKKNQQKNQQKNDITNQLKNDPQNDINNDIKSEIKNDIKNDNKNDSKSDIKNDIKQSTFPPSPPQNTSKISNSNQNIYQPQSSNLYTTPHQTGLPQQLKNPQKPPSQQYPSQTSQQYPSRTSPNNNEIYPNQTPQKQNLPNQLSIKNLSNPAHKQPQPTQHHDNIQTKRQNNFILNPKQHQQHPPQQHYQDTNSPFIIQSPLSQPHKQPPQKIMSIVDINDYKQNQPSHKLPSPKPQYQHPPPPPSSSQHSYPQHHQQSQPPQKPKLKVPTLNYLNHFHSSQIGNLSQDNLQQPLNYTNKQMSRTQSQQPNIPIKKLQFNQPIKSQLGYDQRKLSPKNNKKNYKKWNQLWCTSNNPLAVYQQFIKTCQKISTQIINQLPLSKSQRQHSILKCKTPHYMYVSQGITFNMHYFSEQSEQISSSRSLDNRNALLYDHQTYTQTKRQFYNNNYILGSTGNHTFIKIPLSCLIQYKSILIFCKANLPDDFQKVSPSEFQPQLSQLQEYIHMPFIYKSMTLYAHPQRKYVLLTELSQLIPKIPIDVYPPAYFRKQYLLSINITINDPKSIRKIFKNIIDENVRTFVNRFQSLQSWVINSHDFLTEMHRSGLSLGLLQIIYQQTKFHYFKKIIVSQMVKGIFCDILRSQLNCIYSQKQFQEGTLIDQIDQSLLDYTHFMFNQLFSYSTHSQNVWRVIVKQVNKRYKIVISKQDIIPGYLLGGITQSMGITCDYKSKNLLRKQPFFIRQNVIPRDIFINFQPKTRRYDLDTISPIVQKIYTILSLQPTPDHFQDIVRILDLKIKQIPTFLANIKFEILTYLCNFVPLGEHQQFNHIGIYDVLQAQPHTYCSTKISLLAAKWSTKKKNYQLANKIFQIKFQQNSFWVSQFNPAISQFYDFFSLYNFSIANYQQSVKLAKSSLVNAIKLTGTNSIPSADKHYQLGNIYFKINSKQQSLKQYHRTQQILQFHKQINIPQYAIILLKLSLLYLNFGKVSDCVSSSLQALKIFDNNSNNDQNKIQAFQILSRAYQITRKNNQLVNVSSLCMQKFNNNQNPKILQKMIKISILPKLITINAQDAKTLLKVFHKLQQLQSSITYTDAYNYLHIKAQNQIIMKKVLIYMQNISNLCQDIMKKDLLRKHKSLNLDTNSQASQMLVIFEAIATMVGYNFINGSLKDNYY